MPAEVLKTPDPGADSLFPKLKTPGTRQLLLWPAGQVSAREVWMQPASFPFGPVASARSWLGAQQGPEPAVHKRWARALCFVWAGWIWVWVSTQVLQLWTLLVGISSRLARALQHYQELAAEQILPSGLGRLVAPFKPQPKLHLRAQQPALGREFGVGKSASVLFRTFPFSLKRQKLYQPLILPQREHVTDWNTKSTDPECIPRGAGLFTGLGVERPYSC